MSHTDHSVGRFFRRLRSGGVSWVARRLAFEMSTPTTSFGQFLHRTIRHGVGAALKPLRSPRAGATETVFAFYDLRVAPVTFDFLWFLVGADLMRRRAGARFVHVVIVPGGHQGVRQERDDYENVIDPEARRFRIVNLLVPAISLLPSNLGITIAATRRQAAELRAGAVHLYPERYETSLPTFHHPSECIDASREQLDVAVLRAPDAALAAVDRWLTKRLGGRHLITITLRQYSYMPARNSQMSEWVRFARGLDPASYFVVIVPDTNQTLDLPTNEFVGLEVFGEAAWTLPLRMALYQRAFLNLGVNNGPMGLCWLNKLTRYITFRMLTDGVPQTSIAFNRALGFEPQRSLPFATPFQKWLWDEADTADVIQREFAQMAQAIETAAAATLTQARRSGASF